MDQIDPSAPPGGTGCADCEVTAAWWLHLRRCAARGHVGCCDSSPDQHAWAHASATGHRIVQSFEPGEDWFWDYEAGDHGSGPALAPPVAHPPGQPVPGPAGRVPADSRSRLH
jgi:hypothetical protein